MTISISGNTHMVNVDGKTYRIDPEGEVFRRVVFGNHIQWQRFKNPNSVMALQIKAKAGLVSHEEAEKAARLPRRYHAFRHSR